MNTIKIEILPIIYEASMRKFVEESQCKIVSITDVPNTIEELANKVYEISAESEICFYVLGERIGRYYAYALR